MSSCTLDNSVIVLGYYAWTSFEKILWTLIICPTQYRFGSTLFFFTQNLFRTIEQILFWTHNLFSNFKIFDIFSACLKNNFNQKLLRACTFWCQTKSFKKLSFLSEVFIIRMWILSKLAETQNWNWKKYRTLCFSAI